MNRFLEFLESGMDDYYDGGFINVYRSAKEEIRRIRFLQTGPSKEACILELMRFPQDRDPWIVDMVYDDYYECVKEAAKLVDTSDAEALHDVVMLLREGSAEQSESAWTAALHGSIRNLMMVRTCDLIDMEDGTINDHAITSLVARHGEQDTYEYLSGSSRINMEQCAEFAEWMARNGSAFRAESCLYCLARMALEDAVDDRRVLSAAENARNGDRDLFEILGAVYDRYRGFRRYDWTALELYSGGEHSKPEDLPGLIRWREGGEPAGELKPFRERLPVDGHIMDDCEMESEVAVGCIDGWSPSPALTIDDRLLAAHLAVIRYAKEGDPDCLSVVLYDPERYGADERSLVDSMVEKGDGGALRAIAEHYRDERRHSLCREFALKAVRVGNFEALKLLEWDDEVLEAIDSNYPTDVTTDEGLEMAIMAAEVHYGITRCKSPWSKMAIHELERRFKDGNLSDDMMGRANESLKCEAFRVQKLLDSREWGRFFPWDWKEDMGKDVLEIEFLIDRRRFLEAGELLCRRYWPLTRFGYELLLKAYLGTVGHAKEDETLLELHRLAKFEDYVSYNENLKGDVLCGMREADERRRQAYPPAGGL